MRLTIQRKLILFFLLISLIPTVLVVVLSFYMQDRVMEQMNAQNLKSLADEVMLDLSQKRQEALQVAVALDETWDGSETQLRLMVKERLNEEDQVSIRAYVDRVLRLLRFPEMEWVFESELQSKRLQFPKNVTIRKDTDLTYVPGWLPTDATSSIDLMPPSEWIGIILPLKMGEKIVERVLIGYPVIIYDEQLRFRQDRGVLPALFLTGWHETRYPNATLSIAHADSPEFMQNLKTHAPKSMDELLVKGKALHIQRLKGESRQGYMYPLLSAESEKPRAILIFSVPENDAEQLRVWELWRYYRRLSYAMIPTAVVLSILAAVFLSRRIARPVRNLSASAIAISQGDYEQIIQVQSRDEVGDLAHAFNRMSHRLRQSFDEINQRAKTIQEQNIILDEAVNDLRQERAYVENILRTVSNGVITVDTEGRITRINGDACRTLGVPDATGTSLEALLEDKGLWEAVQLALKDGETQRNRELVIHRANGNAVPISMSTALLRSSDVIIGVVLSFSDLSNVKALQEQVRRQERLAALGSLSAGVAHEIRNPLGIIKGSAEILRKRFGGQAGENGLCEDILEEVNRLSRVVTEFLDFARPRQPALEEVCMDEVVRRTLELAASQAPKNIHIETQYGAHDVMVSADPEQCRQVFLNLFLNACEAMPDGGTLSLTTRYNPETKEVHVEVSDTGMGISEEALGQIFNPFFTTKSGGTGLGLSICHRIIDTHGGRIDVESKPGKGSAFRVFFPVMPSLKSAPAGG